jgi:Tol biopolymer transport system component
MARRLLLLICLAGLAGCRPGPGSSHHLAYVKDGWLWTARIEADGRTERGTSPVRICKLWPEGRDDTARVVFSPKGDEIALEHWDTDGRHVDIRLVEPKQGATPEKVAMGADPSFSPDGKRVAFTHFPRGDTSTRDTTWDVYVFDRATGRARPLRRHACEPFWSSDGKEIALVDTSAGDGSGPALAVDARSGKEKFSTGAAVNPMLPILSPDGRYLAVEFHMSPVDRARDL